MVSDDHCSETKWAEHKKLVCREWCTAFQLLQQAAKNEKCVVAVLQRLIVQQPVQFCPLCRGVAVLVLNGDAVDGNSRAILEPGFHPVGVHVVAAGKQFCHSRILQDLIFGVRSLEPMPSSRCRMKWFLVCPGVSARFLHGFCTVSKRAKGANRCKIGQRVQKLQAQNLRCIIKK